MKSSREEVTLECVKRKHATKECHYNFLVDGIQHRYIDYGCKGKKEDIIKKVKAGKLALHKEWEIDCHVKKPE